MRFLSLAVFFLLLVTTVFPAKQPRTSSIRADLKALIRYTKLEINVFVDTCSSDGFEKVVLNLFPAAEVLRLTKLGEEAVRASGKSVAVNLGEMTGEMAVEVPVQDSEKDQDTGSDTSKAAETKQVETRMVPVSSLDDMLADNGYSTSCPEFIRLTDYGGMELSILRGGIKTLACTKIICVSGNVMRPNNKMPFAADVISFLNDQGFAIYNTYENRRLRFFNIQIDMIFVKKEIMDEMFETGFKNYVTVL